MSNDGNAPLVEPLTAREEEVLALLAQGKSNRAIADELVLSVHTIKWHNRQIYGKLGVADREEAVERARELGLLTPALAQHRPTTPLIGREKELTEIEAILLDGGARLVSIVGPGGMGKTRLAQEVAHDLANRLSDGVAFANLAPLHTPEGIVPTLAQTLSFKPVGRSGARDERQQLLDYLRGKALLLVLDNFEHLLAGAPMLVDIMNAAPQVKLLVTSRQRLKLQVERLYPLQGLKLSRWESLAEARRDPAARLFLQYGQRIRPGFALQAEDLGPLWRIFQLVEGMPLAIILAAAWLDLFGPAEIAAEIERSLDFLEAGYRDLPQRQRSMRAVFDATWQRLSEGEHEVFAALSVFRGGFTLEAAREVADATPRDLRRLMDCSLLARGGEGRFQVHELLRQFAAEQLARAPQREAAVRDAHSAYYLALLREREPELKGEQATAVFTEIESDIQNHQAAWVWAVRKQAFARIGPAAFALATFYLRSGRLQEGLAAFGQAVKKARGHVSGPGEADSDALPTLVHLLAWQSEILFAIGSTDEAEASNLEGLSLLERPELKGQDVRAEKALVQLCLGRVYEWLDRYQEATLYLEESIAHSRSLEDHWLMADAIALLGGVALRRGKYEAAIRRVKEAQRHYRAAGDRRSEAYMQMWAAICQTWWWPTSQAERQIGECRAVFREVGDRNAECWTLEGLGWANLNRGRFAEACALFTEATALLESLGMADRQAGSMVHVAEAMMYQGEYDLALGQLKKAWQVSRSSDMPYLAAIIPVRIGSATLAQGHFDEARRQLAEGAAILRSIGQNDDLSMALAILCCANTENGEIGEARRTLAEALRWTDELRTFGSVMHALPAAALYLAKTGRAARALELWQLARRQPFVANSRWFGDVVGQHVTTAAAALTDEEAAAARERGAALDLWETTAELLEALSAQTR